MKNKLIFFAKSIATDFVQLHLSVHAASLVYITLLSLVPALALSFSILHGLGVQNQLEPVLIEALSPIGEHADQLVKNILTFVNNTNVNALGFMGVAMILYTGISMVLKLEFAFNQIWQMKESRSFLQRVSYYLAILILGPVVFFLGMAFMGSLGQLPYVKQLLAFQPLSSLYYFLLNIMPFLMIVLFLFFIYWIIPNHPVRHKAAFLAALLTSIVWKASGWLFTSIIVSSVNYNIIYSGFAVIVLFIVWVYITWLIILSGALVNVYLQYFKFVPGIEFRNASPATYRLLKIATLIYICESYFIKENNITTHEIVTDLEIPFYSVNEIILDLEKDELVLWAKHEDEKIIVPGAMLNTHPINEIFQQLDFPTKELAYLPESMEKLHLLAVIKHWYREPELLKTRTLPEILKEI
ncbi:MAG: YihY/virulence factor BrkB family protein [Gammaproteobacteria bacterium]|nr:YihY/virulence factor BrkB family protein [Gammaproteobacteria bacterium]